MIMFAAKKTQGFSEPKRVGYVVLGRYLVPTQLCAASFGRLPTISRGLPTPTSMDPAVSWTGFPVLLVSFQFASEHALPRDRVSPPCAVLHFACGFLASFRIATRVGLNGVQSQPFS